MGSTDFRDKSLKYGAQVLESHKIVTFARPPAPPMASIELRCFAVSKMMPVKVAAPYWDNGGRRLLRELTVLYMLRQGSGGVPLSPTALDALLWASAGSGSAKGRTRPREAEGTRSRAQYQQLRRFLFNQTGESQSDLLMDQLFQLVVPWFFHASRDGEMANCGYLAQAESRGWFRFVKTSKIGVRKTKLDEYAIAAGKAADIADVFALGFNISMRDYEEAGEYLTGRKRCRESEPSESDIAAFVTYRYSSSPGNVVRTFTVVTPPSSRYPFCWFQNFYRYSDRQLSRDCSGIAVKLGSAVYLFGTLPPHDGIKLIVLPYAAGKAQILSGLITTCNNNGAPLMSRVVLERSAVSRIEQLKKNEKPDILSYPIPKHLQPSREVLWRIRNHVKFEIGNEIEWRSSDGIERVTAQKMIDSVGKLCDGQFTLGDEPFNPADHIHYPFNQALLLYSAEERRSQNRRRAPKAKF
jgi:hypothetical protein